MSNEILYLFLQCIHNNYRMISKTVFLFVLLVVLPSPREHTDFYAWGWMESWKTQTEFPIRQSEVTWVEWCILGKLHCFENCCYWNKQLSYFRVSWQYFCVVNKQITIFTKHNCRIEKCQFSRFQRPINCKEMTQWNVTAVILRLKCFYGV